MSDDLFLKPENRFILFGFSEFPCGGMEDQIDCFSTLEAAQSEADSLIEDYDTFQIYDRLTNTTEDYEAEESNDEATDEVEGDDGEG